jgi:hypothetical protein
MLTSVTLSNGQTANVKRLGLFELDDYVTKDIPPEFTYTVHLMSGRDVEVKYNLGEVDEEPPPPGLPYDECDEGTPEYYQWQSVFRHRQALEHEQARLDAYAEYCQQVATYIRQTCIPDGLAVSTPDDWDKIYHAALCPQVKMEDIGAALRVSF